MTLSEELSWRGFVSQTTLSDAAELDARKYHFYWGVDPSNDSMTVGNLAMAMMVKHFINYGHKPYLLVGGATGMIGDPDGKSEERKLLTPDELNRNKRAISEQYKRLFSGSRFEIVDNFEWFKDYRYLDFLRDIGKHVPLSQMLSREFVQTRLGEAGSGISYAEFSYVLIQAYDFYYLHKRHGVDLQVCGSDQWGNSVAGVELIRRLTGDSAQVWAGPLVVNPQTGVKFGKSEGGAVWLDANKTSPTAFYQFWVNSEDEVVETYLKLFTPLQKDEIEQLTRRQRTDPKQRPAQFRLADEVTELVHGNAAAKLARSVTEFITGAKSLEQANSAELAALRREIPSVKTAAGGQIAAALVASGLASSNTAARQLIGSGAVYLNDRRVDWTNFEPSDFVGGRLLLRRGKAYKDSALIEL